MRYVMTINDWFLCEGPANHIIPNRKTNAEKGIPILKNTCIYIYIYIYIYVYVHIYTLYKLYIYNHGPFTTADGIAPAKRLAKLGDLWC